MIEKKQGERIMEMQKKKEKGSERKWDGRKRKKEFKEAKKKDGI